MRDVSRNHVRLGRTCLGKEMLSFNKLKVGAAEETRVCVLATKPNLKLCGQIPAIISARKTSKWSLEHTGNLSKLLQLSRSLSLTSSSSLASCLLCRHSLLLLLLLFLLKTNTKKNSKNPPLLPVPSFFFLSLSHCFPFLSLSFSFYRNGAAAIIVGTAR